LVEKEVSILKNIQVIEDDKDEAYLFENEEMILNQNNKDNINLNEQNEKCIDK